MKLVLPLLALLLASGLDVGEAAACSPRSPEPGWRVTESIAVANGLPTDAPIPLGLYFAGSDEPKRGTVRVQVTTLAGTEVEGTFEANDVGPVPFSFESFFRPRVALAPSTRYRITTTIENGTMLEGPATRTFEVTTTPGPLVPAVPANLVAAAMTSWEITGGKYACCDGATPPAPGMCGPERGRCFSTAGEPRVQLTVSWGQVPAADMPFLSFALVDASAPTSYGRGQIRDANATSVLFKQEAARYCVSLEVKSLAVPDGASVKSPPICADHGSQPSFEDFVPDFSEEASSCKGVPVLYDRDGEPTGELVLPGKAALDGGCSTGGRDTGGAGLAVIAVAVLSARGRRTRRSSPCS